LSHHHASTASGGIIIERKYAQEDAAYEASAVMYVGGRRETDDDFEVLSDPIEYEAEVAERRETHEPIELDPEVDISDTAFGI
jgi:hypothetical protein